MLLRGYMRKNVRERLFWGQMAVFVFIYKACVKIASFVLISEL